MKLLRRIVRLGVTDELNHQSKREIVATNYLALILTGAICLLMILRNIAIENAPYEINWPVGIGLLVLPLFLNALFLTTISRLILCYIPVLFIWYSFVSSILQQDTVEQSMFDALRIFLLSVSFIPYLILDRKKPVMLVLGVLPTLASFLFFNYFLRLTGVPSETDILHTLDYQLMGIRSFVAYVILSTGCVAFQAIISDNDRYNQKLLGELKNKSAEIEQQNKSLLQKQSELNEINQHLEELVSIKTQNIKRQNEMLIKYSYTNAHKVRGPVARILGLIQVSRLKTDLNFPWFFEKVEEETRGIDEIISGLSKELNSTETETGIETNNK